jgi:hypothetical protein
MTWPPTIGCRTIEFPGIFSRLSHHHLHGQLGRHRDSPAERAPRAYARHAVETLQHIRGLNAAALEMIGKHGFKVEPPSSDLS